jgi:phage terminase large subunit GpA-like protein
VRFLVAAVDVQKNAFVVQVHGICPGDPFDMVLVDRFTIFKSKRRDQDDERLWVKPGTYAEDWDEVQEQVIQASYPLEDGSGRMAVKLTVCDSGGREGVTMNAYAFFRRLRGQGAHGRFHLVKGDHLPNKPRAYIDHPDSKQKGKNAVARGDVPVLFLNSTLLKDALSHRLDATVPGKGMFRMPDWVPDAIFAELCAEQKNEKGVWINPSHTRNEAWDLAYYTLGACVSSLLRVEASDWNRPPGWAAPWPTNDLVFVDESNRPFANPPKVAVDLGKLAASLA